MPSAVQKRAEVFHNPYKTNRVIVTVVQINSTTVPSFRSNRSGSAIEQIPKLHADSQGWYD